MVGMFQSRSCVRDSVVRIMRCYGGLSVNIFSKSIHMRRHGETCVPQDTVPAKGQTPPGSRDGQVEVGPRATGPVAIMHKVLGETLAVRTVCERAAVGNRTGRQAERFQRAKGASSGAKESRAEGEQQVVASYRVSNASAVGLGGCGRRRIC